MGLATGEFVGRPKKGLTFSEKIIMAEEGQAAVTEQPAAAAPAKAKTEYTEVTMSDGRKVNFAGKRKSSKEVVEQDGKATGVRFDFVNGETRTILFSEIPEATALALLGHGVAQKVGDEWSGETKVEDMLLAGDAMIDRLRKGEFTKAREAGDSFSGASIVIKALVNVTGKTVEQIKKFLDGKLEKAKAAGEKLTRQDLYKSLRNPDFPVGQEIARLEREEATKSTKVSAADLMNEINAEA